MQMNRRQDVKLFTFLSITHTTHSQVHLSVALQESEMEDYHISRTEGPIASFQKHFASLTSSQDFTDVTLVCKDLKPVALHRVILSAFSLWFRCVTCLDLKGGV